MKSLSTNLTAQNISRSISLILCVISMTILGTFPIENTTASEINISNATPLLSKNSPPLDLSEVKCGDADEINLKLLIQNSKMINTIERNRNLDSLSPQEKKSLEVIGRLISITDQGMLDIRNYNNTAKDAKEKDDHACSVLKKTLEASKPLLEELKSQK